VQKYGDPPGKSAGKTGLLLRDVEMKQDNTARRPYSGMQVRPVIVNGTRLSIDAGIFGKIVKWAGKKDTFSDDKEDRDKILALQLYVYCMNQAGVKGHYPFVNSDGSTGHFLTQKDAALLQGKLKPLLVRLDMMSAKSGDAFQDFCMHICRSPEWLDKGLFDIISAHPKGMEKCNMISALWKCAGVAEQKTMEGKISEINKRMAVLERLGIQSPNRYGYEALENTYLAVTGKKIGSKIAYVMFPREDWNGAFYNDQDVFKSLMEKGYSLIICEAGTDTEMKERWFNYGLLESDRQASALKGKKYAGFVWGAHASPTSMCLSSSRFKGSRYFTTKDEKWMSEFDFGSMLDGKAKGVLIACSAGKKETEYAFFAIPVVPYFAVVEVPSKNISQVASNLAQTDVYGSPEVSSGTKLKFDAEGRISGASYYITGGKEGWFSGASAIPAGSSKKARKP
jgi:hypothetical protein